MTILNRRRALTLGGTGIAATLLAACGSNSEPAAESTTTNASASASPNAEATSASVTPSATTPAGPSLKGELAVDSFSEPGAFEAGNEEHKANNVPMPNEPAKLRENSPEGLKAFAAYWVETLNYLMLTGNGTLFSNIDHTGDYTSTIEGFQLIYDGNIGWVTGPARPLRGTLTEDHPKQDGEIFTWSMDMAVNKDSAIWYKEGRRSKPLTESLNAPTGVVKGQIVAHYVEGNWRMVRRTPGSASAAPSVSASAVASSEAPAAENTAAAAEATEAAAAESTAAE
ncbi:MAG: DUF6318 family protein [Rothia sp. (in: high G+C Gram-positive bacteria)]|uniref:DUF6318 family protein n=1 Tax=Rothia sp. (in: high G+C Gram-positive bacteria) TaxID=1885016 RepID=UPI0026DF71E6|nr:DUF6318 family protein [Rothia sp. (in: high G+C Gram-positive bacteria)]MDO5750944.1 DUF6318 family protein [Rothia sp. (in: high G+C Gram-positive bacteria)]